MPKRCLLLCFVCQSLVAGSVSASGDPKLVLTRQYPQPVITTRSAGAEGNRFGFEGGTTQKIGDTYHIFTSEMVDDPIWVKMRFGHWVSTDRIHWQRLATVRESSGEFSGKDERAALWSPMVIWDDDDGRWNMFYVAYQAQIGDGTKFMLNYHGRIWRAQADTVGVAGINGTFRDLGVIMQPGGDADAWEGLQGTDSFYPWKMGDTWLALYGSAKTETTPIEHWLVGFADASNLAGPWRRLSSRNPAPMENHFIENPIVTKLSTGGYLVVYDVETPDAIGYAYSADGIHWGKGERLIIQPRSGEWSKEVRTPLGLVDEGNNRFTLFYTGFEQRPDWDRLLATGKGKETCAIGLVDIVLSGAAAGPQPNLKENSREAVSPEQ